MADTPSYDDLNRRANNGMQGTGTAGPNTTYSGVRAGTSDDDPDINYFTGAATPANMAASTAQGVNSLDPTAGGYNQTLAAQLAAQAAGRGPSLAQMQLQQGTQANIKGAAALAASGRSPAAASYSAAQGAGAANQQAAGQSAMARLQEQYQAQQGLAGITNQMQNAYANNAQLGQQNNQFNAQQQQSQNQFYNNLMGSQTSQTNQYLENKDIARTNNNAQLVNNTLSDKRTKTKIKPGKKMLDEFFEKRGKAACY